MSNFGPKKLYSKFLLGLGAIVLLLGLFFASSLYFHLSSLLDTQVREKADLVFSQVSSVQSYVREVLRPKMYETLPDGEFVIEAMSSSYISRAIMDRLDVTHSTYHYRRVADNARNPQFQINQEERKLLEFFQTHPDEEFWEGYQKIHGKEFFVKARPVIFNASCLTCHGVPEDSPRVLLDRYGYKRGFGHKEGELGGLVIVGVPMQGAVGQVRDATFGYSVLYGGGMLLFFGLVQMFFNKLIMTNLRRLTDKFRTLFQDEPDLHIMEKLDQLDEIEEVVQGLEELGDHLHDMHSQLREHTENLEQMVEVRTEELQLEAGERRSDVSLFVRLLDRLNQSNSHRELWEKSLPLIAKRFNTIETGFTCMLASHTYYTWPEGSDRPPMPDNWKAVLVDDKPLFQTNTGFLPVRASSAASEGILYLAWNEDDPMTEQDKNVLRALGQQLGIAMENITALNDLMRQKDMLQAIVEGIGDPLLLMDGGCNVVLANEAARQLSRSLGGSASDEDCSALFKKNGVLEICPFQLTMERGYSDTQDVMLEDGRSFSIHLFPVAEGAAESGRGIVYVHDVTQERQMLATMQQSEKLATVGQLAAGLAHEMNNPLGVIKCYAELLKGADSDYPVAADAKIILKHASQAQSVLQELLNFARPKQIEPVRLDIGAVVTNAVNVFRVQAENLEVNVVREVASDLPYIVSNEQAVEQILTNLLKNALDAVKPHTGCIKVEARAAEGGMVMIRIADNGPGVAENNLKKLFDPFFTTKEVGRGTGLGLAIVYGLINDLGGSIDVENADGAIFTVLLPEKAMEG